MSIIAAVIIFSVIVLFHEFGHYLAARTFGVEVLEFSLGMGPRLFSRVSLRSGTRWSVKILPFGGSCLMKGEDDDDLSEGAFGTKKIWQRILIVAAGPFFNFVLAFLFASIIIGTAGYDAPVAESLTQDSPLALAGMMTGDEITSIDGKKITIYRDIVNYVSFDLGNESAHRPVPVEWIHDGQKKSADILLKTSSGSPVSVLGLYGGGRFSAHGNLALILRYSLYEVRYWIRTTLLSLAMIGKGRVSLDDVSGPVGIVGVISDTYRETKKEGAHAVSQHAEYGDPSVGQPWGHEPHSLPGAGRRQDCTPCDRGHPEEKAWGKDRSVDQSRRICNSHGTHGCRPV